MINSMKSVDSICVYLLFYINFSTCVLSKFTCKNQQNIEDTEGQLFRCNDWIDIDQEFTCNGTRHCCNGCDESATMCDITPVEIRKKRASGDYCTALSPSPYKTTTYDCDGNTNSKCYFYEEASNRRLTKNADHYGVVSKVSRDYYPTESRYRKIKIFNAVIKEMSPSKAKNHHHLDDHNSPADIAAGLILQEELTISQTSLAVCIDITQKGTLAKVNTGWGKNESTRYSGDSGGKFLLITDFESYITFDKLRAGSETGVARRIIPINNADKDTINFYQLNIICTIILCIISTISITIHLYKFFHTAAPQSLSTGNLTFYCFFLLLIYIFTIMRFALLVMDLKDYLLDSMIIIQHLILTATFIKFIIALDLFLCFRKIAIYLQNTCSLASQSKKFIVYCLLGTTIPLFYTLIFHYLCNFETEYLISYYGPFAIERYIRMLRLFLIIGAYWYIRSASMDRKELWLKYGLHVRMITMLGGFSALISIAEFISIVIHEDEYFRNYPKSKVDITSVYFFIHYLGCSLEGVVIGVLFTFREGTFQPITSPTASSNGTSRQQTA